MATDYLSCAETATLVRGALKRAFPGVKFRVRSSTYSGGASISVQWTDGPRTDRVEHVAKQFEGATFDGMQDLKSHHDIEVDGVARRTLADFIFCTRSISHYDKKRQAAGVLIRQRCDIIAGTIPSADRFGNDWVDNLADAVARDMEYDQLNAAFRRVVLRESDAA